jgi:hypothetical protein
MRSKVFISCGQRPRERAVARSLSQLPRQRGFNVYLAINAQTILEINAEIMGELKNSDYYLFVNFRREQIGRKYRGSLVFTSGISDRLRLGIRSHSRR